MERLRPADVDHNHLLALPEDVVAEEVEVLASARWPRAAWVAEDSLRLSRYTTVHGPAPIDVETAGLLNLPVGLASGYVVATLTERGDPPVPGSLDPTGLSRAFADGLPIREERRVAEWLIAAARRLMGAVRFAPSGVVLTPSLEANIDMAVHSDIWLDPGAALVVVMDVFPQAVPGTEYTGWHTLPHEVDPQWVPEIPMRVEERAALHAHAAAGDAEALSRPVELDGYEVVADLGRAGLVTLQVFVDQQVPTALRGLPWAEHGVITYRIHWEPVDPSDLLWESPTPEHRRIRSHVAPLIARLAGAVYAATGVEITDAEGFVIAPEDL